MALFKFTKFDIDDSRCGMKLCSEAVVLGAWTFRRHKDARRVADAGAGSGILSLLAAQICEDARVSALEIDAGACADARRNFTESPWSERLRVVDGHFADYRPEEPLDVVVSNPPFFATGELSPEGLRAQARHEGTLSYEALFEYAADTLRTDDGRLCCISPAEREQELIFKAEMAGLKLRRLCRLHTRARSREASRLLWDFSTTDGEMEETELRVRIPGGGYSDEYLALVGEFYPTLKA